MKFSFAITALVLYALLLQTGCRHEPLVPAETPLDESLKELLRIASPSGSSDHFLLPDEDDLTAIPQDPLNPLTQEKVALGRQLFFEPGMASFTMHEAGKRTFSCATCHNPETGFRVGRSQGIADGGIGIGIHGSERLVHPDYLVGEIDQQGARPLSVLNVSQVVNPMWSGGFGSDGANVGTDAQWNGDFAVNQLGFAGLESAIQQSLVIHRQDMNPELADSIGYSDLFRVAFPSKPKAERATRQHAALALAAYLRTLNTTRAPFQQWLRGKDNAMTDEQKRGAILFFGKARCAGCHNEANLGSNTFHALGVKDLWEHPDAVGTGPFDQRNHGRGKFSLRPDDIFHFRVPQLYNLKHYPTFFHGSSHSSLEEVVEYKCAASSENPNIENNMLSPLFRPVALTAEEKAQLVAFLREGLFDPDTHRFVPTSVASGLCFPSNDWLSKQQLGCE
jgi:cytochrome c peroxidase